MPQIGITVNGREYMLGCAEGEEERLHGLASEFDGRIRALVGEVGQIGDARLMLMIGLLLLDELEDAADGAGAEDAAALQKLAGRIETLAERLEQA